MGLFWRSKREAWELLCEEIGASYIYNGMFQADMVEFNYKNWVIIMDTFSRGSGKSRTTFTRVRLNYVKNIAFELEIFPQNFLMELGKIFGAQDMELGEPEFDEKFMVKSNEVFLFADLLANQRLKYLLHQQRYFILRIGENYSNFPHSIDDIYLIYYHARGTITDPQRLRDLFDLFTEIIETLVEMEVAEPYAIEPRETNMD